MAEHLEQNQPESLENQHQPESAEAKAEQAERLAKLEAEGEAQAAARTEQLAEARAEIAETADETEQPARPERHEQIRPGDLAAAKKQSYRQSLKTIQNQLPSRKAVGFSRLIHQPLIEKIGEATAKTVMRPSLTLGVALGTLIGSSFFLYLAKQHGFALRGGEFLLSAGLGGLVGLSIEGLYRLAKRLPRKTKSEQA